MTSIGRHILIDFIGVDPALLRDEERLTSAFAEALIAAGAHILQSVSHQFPGDGAGVTGLFLLSESHASYHSYPEFGYLAIDVFTCGHVDPLQVVALISVKLDLPKTTGLLVPRGDGVTDSPRPVGHSPWVPPPLSPTPDLTS
jgi:S-adenosylmethionine decarboxylase